LPSYHVGVDGGGTTTTAVLADPSGDVIRAAAAGAGNVAVLDSKDLARLLDTLFTKLLGDEPLERIRHAALGFAGAGREPEKKKLEAAAARLGIADVTVMTDAALLFHACHGDDRGILLAAGTGSVCIVRDPEGELQQIGGWGYLLGDDGSGYAAGREAMRAALRAEEARAEPTPLTNRLLAFYGLRCPRELITEVHGAAHAQERVAAAARIVADLAREGDPEAERIVDATARALVALCRRGIDRLETEPPHAVALAGRLLAEDSPVSGRFVAGAAAAGLELACRRPALPPAVAALRIARKNTGQPTSEAFLERVRRATE
jgi:N-acetylglucosamine kinase-like BadF-type ATPase